MRKVNSGLKDGKKCSTRYSLEANYGIKFDLKKFYYEMDISEDHQTYFGFMFPMSDGEEPTYFVWTVLPYGYTRAPFIAKSIIKPLISKWRSLGIFVVVYVDDGMAVSQDKHFLKRAALQIQCDCDLLRVGLLPGIEKCFWDPIKCVDWNGIRWDFLQKCISILPHRTDKAVSNIDFLIENWPFVTFRYVSRFVGKISSMHPVFKGRDQLRTRMLQTIINIRHFHECSWDKNIFSIYGDKLFKMALQEIIFWKNNLQKLNNRNFVDPPPSVVGWVDASAFAHGGLVCKIVNDFVGVHRPLTADNLLISNKCQIGLAALTDGAQWPVSGVYQSLQSEVVRDKFDLDPDMVSDIRFTHRMFTSDEILTR